MKKLLLLLALMIPAIAHADIKPNINNSGITGIFSSVSCAGSTFSIDSPTLTVDCSANTVNVDGGFAVSHGTFSVGGSTFVVTGGSVAIGVATPVAQFHVDRVWNNTVSARNGAAWFGYAASGYGLTVQPLETAPYGQALQGQDKATPSATAPIVLQPVGGSVGIGVVSPKSTLDVAGGIGHYSRTIAQLLAITPAQVGISYFCNNCSPAKLVVSTGTSAGNFADAIGGNFQ